SATPSRPPAAAPPRPPAPVPGPIRMPPASQPASATMSRTTLIATIRFGSMSDLLLLRTIPVGDRTIEEHHPATEPRAPRIDRSPARCVNMTAWRAAGRRDYNGHRERLRKATTPGGPAVSLSQR